MVGTPEKRILGMRRTTFILSVLLAVVSVVAGVVGGVAGTMAVDKAKTYVGPVPHLANCSILKSAISDCLTSKCPSSSSSNSSGSGDSGTPSGAFSAPTDVVLKLDCPNLNNTKQTITLGGGSPAKSYVFTPYCSADYNGVTDIGAIIVYSFTDCMQACASMNFNANKNVCVGVEFNADMKKIIPGNYGNCFLKPKINSPNVYGQNLNAGAALDT